MTLQGKYSTLVRKVEKQAHSRFKKKPTLVLTPRLHRVNGNEVYHKGDKVTKARVYIPKRVARENGTLATLMVLHELRENLAFQNGNSESKAHRLGIKVERAYCRKHSISESKRRRLFNMYYRR